MNKEDLYIKAPSISWVRDTANPEGKIYSTMDSFRILFDKFNELWDKIEGLEKRIEQLEGK